MKIRNARVGETEDAKESKKKDRQTDLKSTETEKKKKMRQRKYRSQEELTLGYEETESGRNI